MFGPLSDLRAPLLQGLQLNYDSSVTAASPASDFGRKDKERQGPEEVPNSDPSVENVRSSSCIEAGEDYYPPAAECSSLPNAAVPEEVASCSCKNTCPHYHGNAPPPRPRGKAVSRTIHEITEEAYAPRQHVRCQDPACPRPDSYCKLCCPSFSCKHINKAPGQAAVGVQPASVPARPGLDSPDSKSTGQKNHLSGSSRLHDQLYKGKGIDLEADRNMSRPVAQKNAVPPSASLATRVPTAMRGKATVKFEPHPQHGYSSSSTNPPRLAGIHYRRLADGYEADDDVPQSDELSLDVSLRTVMKLATAFFFIYSAMNSLSEYVTSLLPNTMGDESLFVIQTVLCASSLAAPSIVTAVGELRAMVLGGLTHVVYLLVLMFPSRILVLLSSAFCGFGASLVWVAQGAFLTKCSPHNKRGLFAGVFWGIYYLADIVGNLAAYFVFRFSSQSALFGLGAASAFLGVLLLFIMEGQHLGEGLRTHSTERSRYGEVAPGPSLSSASPNTSSSATRRGLSSQIHRTYENWLMAASFVLLTPMTVYIGFESAFWTGEFTKLFPSTSIGAVLLCTGVGQVLGAFALSWMSDYVRCSSPTFCIGSAASLGGLLICIPLKNAVETRVPLPGPYFLDAPIVAYLAGFFFGVGDGVITSHMFAIIGRLFPGGKKPEIWGIFNMLGNGGSAITYWLGMLYPLSRPGGFNKQIISQIIMLAIGTPLYMIADITSSFMVFSRSTIRGVRFRPSSATLF